MHSKVFLKGIRNLFFLSLIVGGFFSIASAQDALLIQYAKTHRGNMLYKKFGIQNGNRVAITLYNNGEIGGTDPDDIRGAWPYPETEDSYIGDVTPLIGVQLPGSYPVGLDASKDTVYDDTLHSVTIAPGPRTGQSAKVDPTDGHFQGFTPEPGYSSNVQDTLAMSTKPSTWPASWAG